jgi:hypothetical protein
MLHETTEIVSVQVKFKDIRGEQDWSRQFSQIANRLLGVQIANFFHTNPTSSDVMFIEMEEHLHASK